MIDTQLEDLKRQLEGSDFSTLVERYLGLQFEEFKWKKQNTAEAIRSATAMAKQYKSDLICDIVILLTRKITFGF